MGGFGISSRADPLLVEDVVLLSQRTTPSFVAFDDAGVADHFDRQVDAGRSPEEFARIWLHTHPGHSPEPSPTDEHTFARVFRECDWAVMGILARGGASYARLRFTAGPGGSIGIPVEVEFGVPFAASDAESWRAEYRRCVQAVPDLVWQGDDDRRQHPRGMTPDVDLLPDADWPFFLLPEELTRDDQSLCEAGGPGPSGAAR